MQNRFIRLLLPVIFLGLLASVAFLNHRATRIPAASGPDSLQRYGFRLTEVSRAAGIDFVHQAPQLDPRLSAIMPEVAVMGAAVSVVDYDQDGWPDLYVCSSAVGSRNHLYHNLHNGKFEDVAARLGIADVNLAGTGVSMGAVWGDYDNDGYPDLLLYKWGRSRLFHNNGGKGFTDVSAKAGLPQWANCDAATWVDYDRDGHLDLLLTGYYSPDVNLWHLKTTKIMPDDFEYARNGARRYLLRNRGDGTFEDVTQKMGLSARGWTLAVTTADLQGTGYPDLIMANDYGYTEIYADDGGKRFREIGRRALYGSLATGPKSGMNASVGDIMNQGQFALYISNITAAGNLTQGNNLWIPRPGSRLTYDNGAQNAGVYDGGWSFGAQFGDLNNDGALDLVLTNGYISADRNKSYWYDFSTISGGHSAIISDAKYWPPIRDMSLSGYEQKHVWINDGYGKFVDVAQAVGYTDTHDGRAVALADLWNTGAEDVIVANQRGPLLVYRNMVDPQNQWIEFQLEGTRANRGAYGAQVHLYWKDAQGREMQQLQEVQAASGFCAQNDHRLHFGLGKNARIEKAVIRWPSASPMQTILSPKPDRIIRIQEPT